VCRFRLFLALNAQYNLSIGKKADKSMKRNDEPKWWVTLIKLVIGATIIIGGVGMALEYVASHQEQMPTPKPKQNWGIFGDSPIRSNR
jgi:hypothetical protein